MLCEMSSPQSGVGSWMPRPRNDSVATVKMAYPSRTVNSTIIGGITLGSSSANMM